LSTVSRALRKALRNSTPEIFSHFASPFSPSHLLRISQPQRRASCIVTWLGVFPIVTIIFSLFGHWLNLLPTLVRTLVPTAVMVTLMTYVVMPRLTHLFSFWLYP
jgi:antibiotic biosynthesis monooxygenase (ABM) superfamily enzyme